METTCVSLKEIRSEIEACIAQLTLVEPCLATKLQNSVGRAFAENEKMKADKLYREMKKSYY